MVTGAQQYSLPQLQDIIQLLPIAAVLLTPNAKILLANQHYADFFFKAHHGCAWTKSQGYRLRLLSVLL